jgi:CDP-glycerol glycerophosphotransferase
VISRLPGLRQVPQAVGPLRADTILFDSWRGEFSDNPRAISEELHRRGAEFRHVWVLDPLRAGEVPAWVEPVAPGSIGHLSMLGRARYLVANRTVPGFHRKRRGTTFLQTWHGTPLKRIGFETRWRDTRPGRQARTTLERNVPNWDLLLSPNSFSTPIMREAFRFSGEILETGYPRNDLLVSPEAAAIRGRVRAELGIPEGKRAVLYAPTFRDDAPFALEPYVQRLARGLGDDYVVLLRTHTLDADGLSLDRGAPFKDVSLHPDNRELFLAADVLVTDYSSLMFDFAVTRKPILLFTPDLARYRDELRGFYFDLEAEGPGPLFDTVEELQAAVEDLEAVVERWKDMYARFVERFCHLDDGHASERVVDALLVSLGDASKDLD